MAKRQTRRSISVSKEVFYRAQALAREQEMSLSQLIETMLRGELGLPPNEYSPSVRKTQREKRERMAQESKEIIRQRAEERAELHQQKWQEDKKKRERAIAEETSRRAIEKTAEYERRTFENPCREEKCHIIGAHPAHEDAA